MKKYKTLCMLHLLLMLYSTSGIFSKLAAKESFLSLHFCIYYGAIILLLGIYAIGWQQIIKRLPLTTAFANKAVTVVWGIVWGALFFGEAITLGKVLGAALVISGVILFVRGDSGGPGMSRAALYTGILLLGVFISAISQVMLKKAAKKTYDSWLKEYLNPLVFFAYVLFVGTTFLSILAYKGIPLSMGPVLEATSYIYVTIFGVTIFHEKVNRKKLFGLGLILCGILVYAFLG